ncbi:hypothetical protein LU276_03950 [Moraxella haemolytica]|uniref:Uncharacterized protein n=1 Tax=Moraxella equi TaxID=60442 RepID=A0A378QM66_9GAMM|nr:MULTISPECIES: hypothetical protein [Moraxella]OPH36259.1 hypothetical protein B5J93_09380 [Moraxella equi]WII95976.1 hypothetical protein LU276_03950 [Moraxella sp. ZY171148]STZ01986.1 Uncharacterised protein [Moraxella equi]
MVDISRIDLQTLDKENLEKVKLMLDISKIQQDIATSQATVEKMRIENDKFVAETKKIEKEARFYPYVTLGSAMVGGLIVFVLTRFFG